MSLYTRKLIGKPLVLYRRTKKNYSLNYIHIHEVYTPMHSSWFSLRRQNSGSCKNVPKGT